MNSDFNYNNDTIGTDPSVLPVVDTLDEMALVPNAGDKLPDKKKGKGKDILKKVLFTIVVLLLMAGVAFGVYYYLSLGTKNKNTGTSQKILNDMTFYVNETLPADILQYGTFAKIDIAKCVLDLEKVDNTQIGSYDYYVTCDGHRYSAKINIIVDTNLIVTTNAVIANIGDNLAATNFVTSSKEYKYEFINSSAVANYLKTAGGPYVVGVRVKDNYGTEKNVYASLMVIEKPDIMLTCSKELDNILITDKLTFDSQKIFTGTTIRTNVYYYKDKDEYAKKKNEITDGKVVIDGVEKVASFDDNNQSITLLSSVSINKLNEEYGSEFPSDYYDINSYYRKTKEYNCSI